MTMLGISCSKIRFITVPISANLLKEERPKIMKKLPVKRIFSKFIGKDLAGLTILMTSKLEKYKTGNKRKFDWLKSASTTFGNGLYGRRP